MCVLLHLFGRLLLCEARVTERIIQILSTTAKHWNVSPLGAFSLEYEMHAEEIEDLARQIAARMDPDALLDAEDVAAILKCSPRYVTEQYVLATGFPKAIRLTGPEKRRSQPRWRRSEIMAWVDAHRNGATTRGGRPRNRVDD